MSRNGSGNGSGDGSGDGSGNGISRQGYWVRRRRNGWRLDVRSAVDASDIGVELGRTVTRTCRA
jgi:hypothetical protein